ncbi:succinoglycan biosynthesis protein exoi [Rhizobium sp. BK251]|uniref:sunset domain-containing protein n=1 Tax=Rhizobium sp. BK251 TaxID=2512125 RepID=UPI0010ED94D6|nr:succinoglycan biosynthesis protein exoi [Rhizobium sp. BK251]TCL62943.1 hypothetical protein EV286_11849 [Rhizobium sp. BK251]
MRNPRKYWKPKHQSNVLSYAKAAPGLMAAFMLLGVAGLYSAADMLGSVTASANGCNIKGNISINTGEHIYHVPGQEDYSTTKISPQYGERWFCSESEARAAGWRRARN